MAKPDRRDLRATYDDLRRVPPEKVAEIVDGELVVSPRPAARHARAATVLGADLSGPFDRPPSGGGLGGWWLLFEPELHCGDDVLVPDLAGWRRERMPSVPDVAFFTLAPDWVCEVTSPSTRGLDRVRKLPIHAREGVRDVWLLDPVDKLLEVFRLQGQGWLLVSAHEGAARVRAEPFEAIEVDLARFWIEGG